jgi:hypothetical protein
MMEQVVELFGRYRAREIGLSALTATLKNFLQHQPQAPRQGLGWLDLAQQRQPMPVTEFIQLRADMDYLLRSLVLQSAPADTDTTRIGITSPQSRPGDTLLPATLGDNDSTHIAGTANSQQASAIAEPAEDEQATLIQASQEDDDLSTVIAAPSLPRNDEATVLAPPLPVTDATVIAPPTSETEATVLAAPLQAAPQALANSPAPHQAPPTITDATQVAAIPLPPGRDAPKMPHSQRVPPRTVTVTPTPAAAPASRNPTPVLATVAGIALALIVAGGFAWWRHAPKETGSTNETPASTAASVERALPKGKTPADSKTAPPTTQESSTQESSTQQSVTLKIEVDGRQVTTNTDATSTDAADANTADASGHGSVQPPPSQPPRTAAPLPTDADALLAVVKKRIEQHRLLPADDPETATYAIKALIARAPDSNAVSEARKLLSQAHLELARKAREQGDLEAAQTHLDNAFDVRLMN